MRINFNSWSLSCCGGNRFIFLLANKLIDRGHKVTITHVGLKSYSNWFAPIKAEIIECGYSLPERALLKIVQKSPDRNKMLQRLEDSIPNCDVNVATFCFTAYPTVASKKGKPFYLVQHYEPSFFTDNETKVFAEYTYSLPITKLCVSSWLTQKVNGICIGNGIDIAKFVLPKKKPSNNPPKILILNANVDFKRPWLLDKIAEQLSQHYKVVRPVNVSDDELVRCYQDADIFVGASLREGFYYPALEAFACGTAVVSSPCAEYLDSSNCIIVRDDNAESFVNAVNQIIKNSDLKSSLYIGGLRTIEHYNFDNVVDRFLKQISIANSFKDNTT